MGFHRPTDLDEALALIAAGGVPVAGATDWYPGLGERAPLGDQVDLTGVAGLRGITRADGHWRIGAAVTWAEVAAADLPPLFDGLRAAARTIGSVQIQNVATVAGNLCNASPAADGVPPLLTLAAEVEVAGAGGGRRIALAEFLLGPRRTALRRGEIVTAIRVPEVGGDWRGAFLKAGAREYLVISIAMVAAALRLEHGHIAEARLAVGACGPVARRMPALEARLIGTRGAVVAPEDLTGLNPIDDIRGSARHRMQVAAELLTRALREVGV
jgi:CO/xanthine dehydrogenase FAD-binding subunit